jgi:class 3 adenylate cyclase
MAVTYPTDRVQPAVRPPGGSRGWRRLVVGGAPILAVAAVMVIAGVIASYVYDTNRRGAVTLSNDLIDAIDQRIAIQMGAYLAPAEQFLESARAIAGERGVFDGALAAEPFVLATLGKHRQIAGFSYGDPEGNFLYISRNAQGGLDTKLVDRRGDGHRVTWTRRDKDGAVVGTTEDPSDTFDPRTRGWYQGAMNEGHAFWTTPYIFFTVKRPGITYALPQYAANRRLVAVLGIDIELSALSTFLKSLEIGLHGKALVIDAKGRVIAFPSDSWIANPKEGATLPQLDELGDPLLTRIYNQLKVEGFGRKLLDFGSQRIIVSSGALKALTGRNWSVLIVAPESDFLGFVASSGKLALVLSGVVFLLMVALAVLMMWRSLQAERRDRSARERHQALETRAQTLAELAARSNLMDRDVSDGVREATERAAEICQAKRVGVWYLAANGRTLVCEDNFDPSANAHTAGAELYRDEFPRLFAALEELAEIDASVARSDPRTEELSALYLQPLGIEGVHISPIHSGKRLLGMLKVEDPSHGEHNDGMAEFCLALASLFALRYLPAGGVAPPAAANASADAREIAEQRVERALGDRRVALQRRLLHFAMSPDDLASGQLQQAVVAVVRLPDWLPVARRGEDDNRARMDAVVDEVQRAVASNGVGYAALLDDQVVLVAAADGAQSPAVAARLVAVAVLDVRDRLVDLTGGWGEGSEFRIAIDVGPVMASAFGDGIDRNLWGGAIGVAKVLAASGSRRAITVSEAAYHLLSADFLLRQRGSYFLPETGPMRTFVLAGAL